MREKVWKNNLKFNYFPQKSNYFYNLRQTSVSDIAFSRNNCFIATKTHYKRLIRAKQPKINRFITKQNPHARPLLF